MHPLAELIPQSLILGSNIGKHDTDFLQADYVHWEVR